MTRVNQLIQQIIDRTASSAELDELLAHIKTDDSGEVTGIIEQAMTNSPVSLPERDRSYWEQISASVLNAHKGMEPPPVKTTHRVQFLKTAWFRYAAILLLLAGTPTYLYVSSPSFRRNPEVAQSSLSTQVIAAGSNKAVLTIGDNKAIDLSNTKTGISVNNAITYNDGEKIADAGQMLVLTTPRGGQYQAVLSDGTKVWLNAASSIKFPSKFEGTERVIEITGEAYLEVAANKSKPFFVKAGSSAIQVLGTSFNINTYDDEPAAKITLVEGSVKINSTILKPGQAYMAGKVTDADLELDIAWKNGAFAFNNTELSMLFRQIARWYDVEIVYPKSIPTEKMSGEMGRNLNLAEAIRVLNSQGVNCRTEGRKLIVLPH